MIVTDDGREVVICSGEDTFYPETEPHLTVMVVRLRKFYRIPRRRLVEDAAGEIDREIESRIASMAVYERR